METVYLKEVVYIFVNGLPDTIEALALLITDDELKMVTYRAQNISLITAFD